MLPLSRREILARCGTGIGTIALAGVLRDAQGADTPRAVDPLAVKKPPFAAKAKHVVHLFMNGGPSQVDTFDPKPELTKYHGKPIPTGNLRTERKTGTAMKSPFRFKKYGQSGIEVSEHLPPRIDDMAVIPIDVRGRAGYRPSLLLMNCGDGQRRDRASRKWVTLRLGNQNRNLPGFVVMCPGGTRSSPQNWRSAFLPGDHGAPIDQHADDTSPSRTSATPAELPLEKQREQLDLVGARKEREHLKDLATTPQLEARIRTFELAFRMQSEAADVFDLSKETKKVRGGTAKPPSVDNCCSRGL